MTNSGSIAAAPAKAVLHATVEGISEFRLANGLSVILFPDAAKPTAGVSIVYKAGSRCESSGETGMAHILEHMMFKGSKNFPSPMKEASKRGFTMNASTTLDMTHYYVVFDASDDNMDWAVRWAADAMSNAVLTKEDLESEITVIRNEYESGNTPVALVAERMQSLLYDWHNYGKPTIGAMSDVGNARIEALREFYRRWYQPDNAVLVVSGNFEPERVLALVEDAFGAIPRPERALPPECTVEPASDGERTFEVRRPGEAKVIAAGYRVPAARDPDTRRITLGLEAMTEDPKGRLYKALVNTGLADEVFGEHMETRDPGYVIVGAVLKKDGDEEKAREALIRTIEGAFDEDPVTEKELSLMVEKEKTEFGFVMNYPEYFGLILSDFIAAGDWRLFFVDRDLLDSVTPDEITRAWKKFFVRDNRVVGTFIPDAAPTRAEMPETRSAEEIVASHVFRSEGEAVEPFLYSQENINARTSLVTIGGVRAALLPKASRGRSVSVEIRFDYGNLASLTGKTVASAFMREMLEFGARGLTAEDIEDRFTALKCIGGIDSFTTDRDHVAEAIRFAGRLANESTFPEAELGKLVREKITHLASKSDDPLTIARDAMELHYRTLPADDPRTILADAETVKVLKGLTREAVADIWSKIFQTVNARIAVVGDFDPEEVKEAIGEAFTKKSDVPYERFSSEWRPVPPFRLVIDAPQQENAVVVMRREFAANDDDEDAAAVRVACRILGGDSGLSSRLADRLREKDGISYTVSCQVDIPLRGNRAVFSGGAMTSPENLARAEKSLREELGKAVRDGVTENELEAAKAGILAMRRTDRSLDSTVASGWLTYIAEGEDWGKSREIDEAIARLTVDDVNRAMRKMIVPSEVSFVLAGDREKAAKEGRPFD